MKTVLAIVVLAVVVLGYVLLTKNKENVSSMEVGQNGTQEPSVSDRIDAQFGISEEDAYKMYPDAPRQ